MWFGRAWFKDIPLSQLLRGISHVINLNTKNNYKLERVVHRTIISENPTGITARPGSKKAKIPFVKFSLIAFPLLFKPSRVPIRTFNVTFVRWQRRTIKAFHHWFGQLEVKNEQIWDTTIYYILNVYCIIITQMTISSIILHKWKFNENLFDIFTIFEIKNLNILINKFYINFYPQ